MFAKLLKHELKATCPLMAVFSAAALAVGIVGVFVMRGMDSFTQSLGEDSAASLVLAPLFMLFVFLIIALVIYYVGTELMLLYRYYKNKFTDEGYLTFTLPVKSYEIFLSSLTCMLIWTVVKGIVLAISVSLMALLGADWTMEDYRQSVLSALELYEGFSAVPQVLVGCVYAPALGMTCITVGAVMAKKHKLLMSVGVYYIFNMVQSVIGSFFATAAIAVEHNMGTDAYLQALTWGELLLQVSVIVGGYFLSVHLMDKKLNLP